MNYKKWKHSSRMTFMIIKHSIPEVFRGVVSEKITNAKEFLIEIEKRFAKNDKVETNTLLLCLITMKYKGKGSKREQIMEISRIASKFKALKLDFFYDMLLHLALLSLRTQYNQFNCSYNC